VLFYVLLCLPFVVGITQEDASVSPSEKRYLATFPDWSDSTSLTHFFTGITNYASDRFGFRETFITQYRAWLWAAGQSPSNSVVRGRDDWLFLKFKDPLHTQHRYSNKTIKNILKRRVAYIERMYAELEDRNIAYSHLVAANKQTVYPEFLPAIYSLTDVDATFELFKSLVTPSVAQLSLYTTDIVRTVKQEEPQSWQLYFKNDTHWNDLGAHKAFLAVTENLAHRHPNLLIDAPARKLKIYPKSPDDLADYVGLGATLSA